MKLASDDKAITYTIATHYLSAIVNGDTSGMEDREIEELDSFLNTLPNGLFTTATDENGDDVTNEFGLDDVTGLRGDVTDMILIPYIED